MMILKVEHTLQNIVLYMLVGGLVLCHKSEANRVLQKSVGLLYIVGSFVSLIHYSRLIWP